MKLLKWLPTCFAAAVLAGCGGGGDDPPAAPATYSVTYRISGSTPIDVTYSTPGGGTAQERITSGTFTRALFPKAGDFLYVSGQTNSASDFGLVIATISVNGTTFRTTTSRGPFVIATASGSCC